MSVKPRPWAIFFGGSGVTIDQMMAIGTEPGTNDSSSADQISSLFRAAERFWRFGKSERRETLIGNAHVLPS